jgi:hypothetical protein
VQTEDNELHLLGCNTIVPDENKIFRVKNKLSKTPKYRRFHNHHCENLRSSVEVLEWVL